MSFGMKGMARSWGPGIVSVEGSFTVSGTTVSLTRPSRPGFTVVRRAAGIYEVQLVQAFQSVCCAFADVGPATGLGTSNVVVKPLVAMITQDFFGASATQWVVDPTGKKLVISLTNQGGTTLTELTANYRCDFSIDLCESQVNK